MQNLKPSRIVEIILGHSIESDRALLLDSALSPFKIGHRADPARAPIPDNLPPLRMFMLFAHNPAEDCAPCLGVVLYADSLNSILLAINKGHADSLAIPWPSAAPSDVHPDLVRLRSYKGWQINSVPPAKKP